MPQKANNIETVQDFKCPTCKKHSGMLPIASIIGRTKPEFHCGEHTDPHYAWIETIKCLCGTTYKSHNGT